MRNILLSGSALVLALGLVAQPQAAELTATAGMKSNGFFHGVSVTGDKPMMFGAVHYALPNGIYAFGKSNNVEVAGKTAVELDVGGGIKRRLGRLDIDVGALSYNFSDPAKERVDEVYLSAGYNGISAAIANNTGGQYLQLNASRALRRDLALSLHLGNTLPKNGAAYMDAALNIDKHFKRFSLNGELVHSAAPQVGGTKFSLGISRQLRL